MSILSFSGQTISFTFVNDTAGAALWASANIVELDFNSEAASTDSPIAPVSGTTTLTADDLAPIKVIEPVRARAVLLTDDISIVESVISNWQDVTQTFTITAKSFVAKNMCISSVALDHVPEQLNMTRLTIEFEQVTVPAISGYTPKNSADSSSYGLGTQPAAPSTNLVSSILTSVNTAIGA